MQTGRRGQGEGGMWGLHTMGAGQKRFDDVDERRERALLPKGSPLFFDRSDRGKPMSKQPSGIISGYHAHVYSPLDTRRDLCVDASGKLRSVDVTRPEPMAGSKITPAQDRTALHERQPAPPPPPPPRFSGNLLTVRFARGFFTLSPLIHLPGRSFPALVLLRSEPGLRPTSGSAPRSRPQTRAGPLYSILKGAFRNNIRWR